ncbi:MAG: hypothetical protein RUMPE_01245 [Eubacteriales bacterium SKADARSKE-1]|nr:hypothetical protein [Eubacteriales bacterium SKADARSKE-1]
MINFKKTISLGMAAIMFSSATGIIASADLVEPQKFDHTNANYTITKKNNGNEQLIFSINNCEASKEYDFKIPLKSGERLVPSKNLLGFDTGEALIMSGDSVVGIIDAPWAISANGTSIPTYYKFNGNTLTQVISHTCDDAFPITADPSVWQITMCAVYITSTIAGFALPIAKIIKIRKAIKAVGSIRLLASIIIGCMQKKVARDVLLKMGGKVLLEVVEMLTGLDGVKANCDFNLK